MEDTEHKIVFTANTNRSCLSEAWWDHLTMSTLRSVEHRTGVKQLAFCEDDRHDIDIPNDALQLCPQIEELGYKRVTSWHRSNSSVTTSVEVLFESADTVILLQLLPSFVTVQCWSPSPPRSKSAVDSVCSILPKKDLVEDESITPFAFWRYSSRGPAYSVRDLSCPSWDELRGNYTETVQQQFDSLMKLERPDEVGKIILWHGIPGTGKTHLVRALAREWSTSLDATVEFVLDYQEMFDHADYMYSVLLDDEQHSRMTARERLRRLSSSSSSSGKASTPLRIIVIEDGADLFSVDCRHKTGFSRFLNASDGIVGQGLRLVFLLTANEPIDSIDPAVRRAGRCLQEVKFEPFTVAEANEWLRNRGNETTVTGPTTLADLYAMTTNREVVGCVPTSGFGF